MADFHYYPVTITTTLAVPATGGAVTPFSSTELPGAIRALMQERLRASMAAVTLPVVTIGAGVEVP